MAKFRIYKANKKNKCDKYIKKLQKHYDETHIPGQPWIIALPVVTYEGKYACTLVNNGTSEPGNDGDDGIVDSIEPPVVEE